MLNTAKVARLRAARGLVGFSCLLTVLGSLSGCQMATPVVPAAAYDPYTGVDPKHISSYWVAYPETETTDAAQLRANFDKKLATGKITNDLWLAYLTVALKLANKEQFSYFVSQQGQVPGADLKRIQADLLIAAAQAKDTAMLEWLTTDPQWQANDFDPNGQPARSAASCMNGSCSENYITVLMRATALDAPTGNLDWLIQHGADLQRQDQDGNTVLNSAVETLKPELVDYFLAKGLAINSDKSRPAVFTAIRYLNLEMLKHLVDKGASLAIQYAPKDPYEVWTVDSTFLENEKLSPLGLALTIDYNQAIIDYLFEQGETPDKPENAQALAFFINSSNVFYSAYSGQPDLLKRLLSYKPNVNARDANGHTPVMALIRQGDYSTSQDAFNQLVAAGAELKVADNQGKTLLMYAAETGNLSIAQALLFKGLGSEIARQDNAGHTALYYANASGNNDMLRYFQSIPRPFQP